MREILFRGKRIATNDWVEGSLLDYGDGSYDICSGSGLPGELLKYCVYPETVGQFTGLTDKNGVKIFEGDMCRVTSCVLVHGKIRFQNGCFWFVDGGGGGMLRLGAVKINGFQIEVIGNIHDNPDLV